MMQPGLKAVAQERIADADARKVYLCVARHSEGDKGPKRMAVRQIAAATRLKQVQVMRCVADCEFLSLVDDKTAGEASTGDRLVEIGQFPLPTATAADVVEWISKIVRKGYTVEFVGYIESARTPGFLGAYAGVTDHEARQVRIATLDKSEEQIIEALAHEFDHVCGKQAGRSGKHTACGGQRGVL